VLRTNVAMQIGNNDMEAAVFGRFKHKNKTNDEEETQDENVSSTMPEMNNTCVKFMFKHGLFSI
jgi:hypothetical protein